MLCEMVVFKAIELNLFASASASASAAPKGFVRRMDRRSRSQQSNSCRVPIERVRSQHRRDNEINWGSAGAVKLDSGEDTRVWSNGAAVNEFGTVAYW